jgi:fluoride exporter
MHPNAELAATTLPPMIDRRELGAIFLGGTAGALLRTGVLEALGEGAPGWPWATFAVNAVGAFLLGAFVAALPPVTRYRPLLTTGFCGALTIFSTMQLELLTMLEAGEVGIAIAYLGGSVIAGYAGIQLAIATVRRPRPR